MPFSLKHTSVPASSQRFSGIRPAGFPLRPARLCSQDIDQLREQSQLAQKGLAEQRAQLTEQMDRASERLKAVDEKILDLNRAARKDVAGIALDVEAVRREFQELRGQIELLNYQQSQLQTAIDGASPSSDSLPAPTPEPQAPTQHRKTCRRTKRDYWD
ncbi:MAG: hypothetical protein R3C68_12465 [Myxococcota bacterium]